MLDNAGWKKRGPLLMALTVLAVLAAVTLWMRKPDGASATTGMGTAAKDASTPADASNTPPADIASRRRQALAPMSTVGTHEQVAQSIARRERMRADQARQAEDSRQKAVATYRSERADPAWAPQKENELNTIAASPAIAEAKIVPKSLEVDCKRTICRLNGTFASSGEAEDWIMLYMASVGGGLPNSVVTRTQNPDGTTGVEIYGRGR